MENRILDLSFQTFSVVIKFYCIWYSVHWCKVLKWETENFYAPCIMLSRASRHQVRLLLQKIVPQAKSHNTLKGQFFVGCHFVLRRSSPALAQSWESLPRPRSACNEKKTSAFLAQCQRPHGKVPNLIFKHSEFGRHSCVIILSILWADHSTWKAKRSHEWAQSRRGTWFKLELLFHSMIMIDMQSHQTTFQGVCVVCVVYSPIHMNCDTIKLSSEPHHTQHCPRSRYPPQ